MGCDKWILLDGQEYTRAVTANGRRTGCQSGRRDVRSKRIGPRPISAHWERMFTKAGRSVIPAITEVAPPQSGQPVNQSGIGGAATPHSFRRDRAKMDYLPDPVVRWLEGRIVWLLPSYFRLLEVSNRC